MYLKKHYNDHQRRKIRTVRNSYFMLYCCNLNYMWREAPNISVLRAFQGLNPTCLRLTADSTKIPTPAKAHTYNCYTVLCPIIIILIITK